MRRTSLSQRRARTLRRRGRRLRGRLRARTTTSVRQRAEGRLRAFRQASVLAVAMTGLLLLIVSPEEAGVAQQGPIADTAAQADTAMELPDTIAVVQEIPLEDLTAAAEAEDTMTSKAAEEATGTLRDLWFGFVENLPKYGIALGILVAAWILVRTLRLTLTALLRQWERAHAITALSGVVIWLLATGIAVSVLVGDIRALVGSLGLVGLALSWALQTPIESFTGWLLNSFHGFYRVGDRIAVGEVHGDVYRIDFLTTTVWEYGGSEKSPGVQAEQPTGRMITFPNNEILAGMVINYTRDFPYVWDELTMAVANESDLSYSMQVLRGAAEELIGDYMREPARRYRELLQREGLEPTIADAPQVFASLTDWGANLTVRYLVGAREKRAWKSNLVVHLTRELNRPDHAGRILPVYPRQQIQLVRPDGSVAEPGEAPSRRAPDDA